MEIFKLVKLNYPTLSEPDVIKSVDNGNTYFFTLGKEAISFIYDNLDMTFRASKDIYKASIEVWKQLVSEKLVEMDKPLREYYYILRCDTKEIIALSESDITEKINSFNELLSNCMWAISNFSVLNFVVKSKDGCGCLFGDIDLNGKYSLYDGVYDEKRFVVGGSPLLEEKSFEKFIVNLDTNYELKMAERIYPIFDKLYDVKRGKEYPLSVREVLSVVNQSKCKVALNSDGMLESIEGFSDSSHMVKLVNFLNSFSIPFKSLKKMGYLRKSMRYGEYALEDMLEWCTFYYLNNLNNITSKTISDLMNLYYNEEVDKFILEEKV